MTSDTEILSIYLLFIWVTYFEKQLSKKTVILK
jgi:hypothetical protein